MVEEGGGLDVGGSISEGDPDAELDDVGGSGSPSAVIGELTPGNVAIEASVDSV